jgi:hypothetical protein
MADDGRELETHTLVVGSVISFKNGARVKKGEAFVQWDPYNVPILSKKAGKVKFAGLSRKCNSVGKRYTFCKCRIMSELRKTTTIKLKNRVGKLYGV